LLLPLKHVGESVLRRKADKVDKVDKALARLLDDMVDTMYAANGVGLAAPQVGVSKRLFVADAGDGPIRLVNPRLVVHTGRAFGTEGCLSIPGIFGQVERWKYVVIKGLDELGDPVTYEATGLLAVVFQHELDHLDGQLFTDLAVDLVDAEALEREAEELESE
jgi:peptide deformylase